MHVVRFRVLSPFVARRDVRCYGKKRLKRKGPPRPPQQPLRRGNLLEYLEFGATLGLSVDETIQRYKDAAQLQNLELNAEAKAAIEKFEREKAQREDVEREMQKVANRELDWSEMQKALQSDDAGHKVETVPLWASAKKFNQPKVDLEALLVEGGDPKPDPNAYGQFLLKDADVGDNFSYEDLEAMVAQLPENLVREGEWHERPLSTEVRRRSPPETAKAKGPPPPLAARPAFHDEAFLEFQAEKQKEREAEPAAATKKTRKAPALARPNMKTEEPPPEPTVRTDLAKRRPKASQRPRPKLRAPPSRR